MKKLMLFYVGVSWIVFTGICVAQAPHEIGGFILGKDIQAYKEGLVFASDMPIRYLDSIHEVEIKPIPGFKSGLLTYGTCLQKDRILRIRLKYVDSSKKFYDELLKRFKQRFGEPDEWRGDPFHIVINWKWSFTDKDNHRISLQLQHNIEDVEEKIGNTVKLSLPQAIEAENRCYEKASVSADEGQPSQSSVAPDWNRLIPR